MLLRCCIYVSVLIGSAYGYGNKVPDEACNSMNPLEGANGAGHNANPQTKLSPFSMFIEPDAYQPGKQIQVQLNSTTAIPFEGFLIEARGVDVGGNCGQLIGNFTSDSDRTHTACGGQGLSHADSDYKTSITVTWNPPSKFAGNIQFRTTFVQEETVFWVNVPSKIIYENASNADQTTAPQTDLVKCPEQSTLSTESTPSHTVPVPKTRWIKKYEECGQTVGCFSDCKDDQCNFVSAWKDVGEMMELRFKMLFPDGSDNKWIAVGFSDDDLMGDDSVIECISVDGNVKPFQSFNYGNKKNKNIKNSGIQLLESSFVDGVMECKLAREKTGKGIEEIFDLRKDWKVMVTYGPSAKGYNKVPHDDSLTWISDDAIDFQKAIDITVTKQTYPLLKAHAALMVIAWLATAATGLLTARYMKPYWAKSTIQGMKVWFWIHRSSMVLTLLLTVAGFILAFVQVKGYSQITGAYYKKAHPILGIIVTILVFVNALMSNFRTGPGTPYRPLFNFAHFSVGTGSYILGVITIFLGVDLRKLQLPKSSYYILAAYCSWVGIVYVLAELIPILPVTENETSYEMGSDGEKEAKKPPKERTGLKKLVLMSHILTTWSLSAALVYIIAIN